MTDYLTLSEKELRQYIKSHPVDEEAFQHYLRIMRAKPGRVIVSTEEQALVEMRKRINENVD